MAVRRQRARSAKALENDEIIRNATISVVLRDGIDAMSFREVAREADLTHGALYARFEDVGELLVDLWSSTLLARAETMCELAGQAAKEPNATTVRAVIDCIRNAASSDVVTVRVLLTSRRFTILHEEIESFIHDCLEGRPDIESRATYSRTLGIFSLIITEIMGNALLDIDNDYLDFLEEIFIQALIIDPRSVASIDYVETSNRVVSPVERDLQSQLAFATISAIGTSGYRGTTISRIARRAKCSPGAIYRLYPSKEDLVIAALKRLMRAPWITIESFSQMLDEGALAQLLYSSASPENGTRKHFVLEMALAAGHNEKLRDVVKTQMRGLEVVANVIEDISDEERIRLQYLIRSIVSLSLASSFLSTVTKVTELMDFNQIAEPFRQVQLKLGVTSWELVQGQLAKLARDSGR